MMLRSAVFLGLFVTTVLAGCGAGTKVLRLDGRHPADARAPEAPVAAFGFRLQPDEFDQAVMVDTSGSAGNGPTAPPAPETRSPSPVRHHEPGRAGAPLSKPTPSGSGSVTPDPQSRVRAIYACPMHAEVTDTTASDCPKCGMTLVRRKARP